MKSSKLFSIVALTTLLLLGACGKKEEAKSSTSEMKMSQTSSSKKVNKTSSEKVKASSTVSQEEETAASSEEPKTSQQTEQSNIKGGMNVDAISNGDFSSVAGTWQNDEGVQFIFDKSGNLTRRQDGADMPCIVKSITVENGRIDAEIDPTIPTPGGFIISLVPKGIVTGPAGTNVEENDVITGTLDGSHPYYKISD